ncbi:MAG: hypothetical protein QOI12_3663 [Alphaproteobacteria bacterium]|jgi:hypothetical protein|nr:hypothetical protein [Alphaproteobacteria bacterium]
MAQFVPPIDPATMEHGSEVDIARSMQSGLSDAFLVMHSLPWVYPARDDIDSPAREGEADFLILHRKYGVLILEVKGGEITVKNRTWHRRVKAGLKEIKDPVRQARRTLWALKRRVELICGKAVASRAYFSAAIAFPHCLFKDMPPADLPVEAIITLSDMASLEAAIIRAFRAGGGGNRELSPQDFDAVRRALAPEFQVYEPLHVQVGAVAETLAALTRQQLQVLRGFGGNSRAIINGVAGSGKTLLAIQRARSFAAQYGSVLLTCYNAELAKWLREELAVQLVENGGRLTVWHFHRLASDLCKTAGVDFLVPPQDQGRWWDEIAPDLLAHAAMELYSGKAAFDAMVIDEAQDFSPGWWDALAYLSTDQAPMWAFLDKAQSLRREPVEPPIAGAFRFELNVNCRNTRRIVACANAATQNEGEPFELAPLGRPPKIIVPQSPAAISGLIQQEVRTLFSEHLLEPRQIALVGPAGHSKGPLANVYSISDVPVVDSATEWREGKGLLCTTARSFKGLEADVIILYDFAGLGPLFTMSDLYVAMTRPRSYLIIIARDRSTKLSLEKALAVAIALGSDQ